MPINRKYIAKPLLIDSNRLYFLVSLLGNESKRMEVTSINNLSHSEMEAAYIRGSWVYAQFSKRTRQVTAYFCMALAAKQLLNGGRQYIESSHSSAGLLIT